MLNFRNIIIYITIFGMELCWLYAALNAANKAVADKLSIPLLLTTLLISCGVSHSLKSLRWPKTALTILTWIIWPIAMLLMIKIQLFADIGIGDSIWLASIPQALAQIFSRVEPALMVLISSAVLWWLGRRLAYSGANFAAAIAEAQFGLVILVIVFFVVYEAGLDQSSSVAIAITFFSLALFGTAISHGQDSSWLGSWRKGQWPGILLVSVGIILVSGLLISVIFTPDLIQLFLKGLKWAWTMIERLLSWIASLVPQSSSSDLPPMPSMPAVNPEEGEGITLPEWLRPGLILVWEIIVAGFVVVAIWRVSSQIFGWMRRQARGLGAEAESLRGAFRKDLLDFIKNFLAKIFRIKFKTKGKKIDNVPAEIASVRELYRDLLRWAARAGFPRQKSQTPEEYRFTLANAAGDNQNLLYITRQYMDSRYGAVLPSEADLNQLRQKWSELKKLNLSNKSRAKSK